MILVKALKNRAVFRLWVGQVGSSVGDEIYRMAFIWLAVSYIGEDTGYLAALQLLAVLGFGIFGAKWADRWSPYKTMIGVDLLRAVITLTPVVLFYLHRPSFVALVFSTICLSGLGAFFEPALQTVLPMAAGDAATLKAANGLMSTTMRLARVVGPAIFGLLSVFIATIHFFTLNAFSYLLSTWSVFSIRKSIPTTSLPESYEDGHILSSFLNSLKLLHTRKEVTKAIYSKSFTGGIWYLVYGLGMALLAHEIDGNSVKSFGMVMGTYGAGNLLGALVFGSLERKKSERMVYLGILSFGVCFPLVAISTSFPLLLLFTGLTGFVGPINDIAFTDLVQSHFKNRDLHKIFRLRLILETSFSLVFMAISPMLFHFFPVRTVIFSGGMIFLVVGLLGLRGLGRSGIVGKYGKEESQ
jgi:DHA3 family macrolide efflux protein-like MFS transporter